MNFSTINIRWRLWQNIILRLAQLLLLIAIGLIISTHVRAQPSNLFASDDVLEFTLDLDMKALMKDRGEDPQYHKAILQYKEGAESFDIPVRVKARGNFRKNPSNCKYPPLFLNFKKLDTPPESIFKDQDKTKLVTTCRADEFVVSEYLVYKLYQILEPEISFRARLVKVFYHDNEKDKDTGPLYGILLEEEKQLKNRLDSKIIEKQGYDPKYTDQESFLEMSVFQYMIGNTDWSVQYQQNIILLKQENRLYPLTVPYDFDHAGIVRAPYAHPAPELKMTSTLQRRYRGYCLSDMTLLNPVFEKFNALKEDFYAVYRDNTFISDGFRKQTLSFLDDFYETINNPKKAKQDFLYPCDPFGTGNVIIRGLNTD